MAAANTDKFRKKESNFSTTLSSAITDSDTTIPLSSTSGLPTDTAITLTIDRVDAGGDSTPSSMERVTGVISGNNLTNALRGEDGTSAQAHSSGAVVEDIWDGETWNDALDGILEEHDQDGGHGAVTADSVNIGSTIAVTGVLDEDDMASDSAVKVPTQQSVKAYVDNKYAFQATMSAAQTVSSTTITNANFDTEVFDYGNNFDASTGKFTVPVSGIYAFNVRTYINALPDGKFVQVYLGTRYLREYNESGGDKNIYLVQTLLMSCTASGKVFVRYYHNSETSKDFGDSNTIRFTEFSGFLVQRI